MRFICALLVVVPWLKLLVANVFPQGPSLVIALGRFFRVPLSDDESGVFFGLFSVCIVNVLNFHLFFTYRFIYQKKLFVIVIVIVIVLRILHMLFWKFQFLADFWHFLCENFGFFQKWAKFSPKKCQKSAKNPTSRLLVNF